MKKIKWGVIGTAGIARSCTIPGMIQAYNCELYAEPNLHSMVMEN